VSFPRVPGITAAQIVLLVLDNFEQLVDGGSVLVAELLGEAPAAPSASRRNASSPDSSPGARRSRKTREEDGQSWGEPALSRPRRSGHR
jgi:hypothetical protein